MKKKRFMSLLCIALTLGWSCGEEEIPWNLETDPTKLLVVEGMLTNERKVHEIRISHPMTDPNTDPEMVSGALVSIFVGGNSTRLREREPGIYVTGPNARAVYGKVYTLFIYYQGIEYYATSSMVPVTPLYDFSYGKLDGHDYLYTLNLQKTNDPSMVEILLDWSHLPAFSGLPEEETHARIVYYSVNSIDVNEIFKPAKEKVVFPVGTIAIRKKYSLSPAQEHFVRTLMAETEWRGGSFDVQPGNTWTNLSEGAIGYFAASTVVSDTNLVSPLNK